jgi:SagB-type dehydrogenase family enzyme
LYLQWRQGVSASETTDGVLRVEGLGSRFSFRAPSPKLRQALLSFAPPGEDEERLAGLVENGNGGLDRWYYYLERLTRRGLICYSAHADGKHLVTLVPASPQFAQRAGSPSAVSTYQLSRFAYLRRQGTDAVLESPLVAARVIFNCPEAATLVGPLASSTTIGSLTSAHGLPADAVRGVLSLLWRAGFVHEVDHAGLTSEDNDPALETWEFHDLLFHSRSRKGRTDAPYGGTCRFAGRTDAPAALKPPPAGPVFELYRPDLAQLRREDPPFALVQEQRRSIRSFDSVRPITARQLGEFLFRVARVRERRNCELTTTSGAVSIELTSRPYPAGGSLHEIEFYLVVNRCSGLEKGLYYYEPAQNRLIGLTSQAADLTALLADAANSAGAPPDEVQVLVILAARFSRTAWKYESIAYALTLKHVGVLYQTMYLAATAMGLGACAVGGGDADAFARAAGTSYAVESSVGEFLLGSERSEKCPCAGPPAVGENGSYPVPSEE